MFGSASHVARRAGVDAVDQPAGLEHQRPDDAGDDLRQHERREVQDPQQRAAVEPRVEQQRHAERERQLERAATAR